MKLLTKGQLDQFAKVGSQENNPDPLVIVKFFNPTGSGTWFAREYDPGEQIFFGYVTLFGDHNDEWGFFPYRNLSA